MIEDNTINFIDDKKYDSYSFRYYLYTATMYMNHINTKEKGFSGDDVNPSSSGKYTDRWDMAHKRFHQTIKRFKKKLQEAEHRK